MSNGKPIKEILPDIIRKLIIQRKHYLKQQRINRRKKNRDPNQPPLPGMKQGGQMPKSRIKSLWKGKAKDYPGAAKVIKLNKLGKYKKPIRKAKGGFVKGAGGTKRVPGSGAATKGTNFEGIF